MSLKSRLTISLMLGIGVPIATAAVVLAVFVPRWLRDQFDEALETRARALVSLTREVEGEIEFEFSDQFLPEFEDDEEPWFFELWVDEQEIERSRSFYPSRELRHPDLILENGLSQEPRLRTVALPDGRDGRQVQMDFVVEVEEPDEEDEADDPAEEPFEEDEAPGDPVAVASAGTGRIGTVVVAGSTEELDGFIARMRLLTAVGTLGLLLLLAAVVRAALSVGLRTLGGLMQQVASIDAESLGRRVELESSPVEIVPLLQAFNRLLDRVEAAFQRERQLTADIAHELKTPIAELRSLGEVGERWPEDRGSVVKFFADARGIALQMERVVTHLLALARHDAGRHVVQLSEIPLRKLLETAWRPLEPDASQRNLQWDLDVDPSLCVTSDAGKLELMLSNLLSNAVAYSRPGTAIHCAALAGGLQLNLTISNEPANLSQDDLNVMFDRFWRKDEARTGGRSAGLGLSLVRAFADMLDIGVRATLTPSGLLRITLAIPAAAEAGAALEHRSA